MTPTDRCTQLFDKVLNLFLADSPDCTGLGVAIGLSAHVLILIFERVLSSFAQLNLIRLLIWAWPVIGVVAMNARAIGTSLKEESVGNEQIDLAIRVFKRIKMSAALERHQYILLIAKVIEDLNVHPKSKIGLRTDLVGLESLADRSPLRRCVMRVYIAAARLCVRHARWLEDQPRRSSASGATTCLDRTTARNKSHRRCGGRWSTRSVHWVAVYSGAAGPGRHALSFGTAP